MSENDIRIIQAVIATLGDERNGLRVSGHDNMSKVIGCIGALQEIVKNATNDNQGEEHVWQVGDKV